MSHADTPLAHRQAARQDDPQLKDRLNQIAEKITSEAFLSGQGLGNEIGFWIFDYPPEHELQVREYLTFLKEVLARQHGELTVDHVNLLRVLRDYLHERGFLDKAIAMQQTKGDAALLKALRLAEQALAAAQTEWQTLHDELSAPDRHRRQQEASNALTDLKVEEARLTATLEERQRRIDAVNPELLAQDLARFTQTADAMQRHAQERDAEITRLGIQLETLGANGLEERRDETGQQLEAQQRRHDQLQRRADALELLLKLLKEQRQEVTIRLQAPLQKHLNRYLKLLFPGAELTVDEALKPETLIRTQAGKEERGDLEALSFGAREQMGLISRLAYADLLKEAGRPTLIILDDALVHCDRARREQMTRILFDAAQRHQILMFTCHPENWQDLGVVYRDIRAFKEAS